MRWSPSASSQPHILSLHIVAKHLIDSGALNGQVLTDLAGGSGLPPVPPLPPTYQSRRQARTRGCTVGQGCGCAQQGCDAPDPHCWRRIASSGNKLPRPRSFDLSCLHAAFDSQRQHAGGSVGMLVGPTSPRAHASLGTDLSCACQDDSRTCTHLAEAASTASGHMHDPLVIIHSV